MSLPTTPQSWANRLTKILSVHLAAHGLPRFPIDVAAQAQDFPRQVIPDAPITMVGGLNLSKSVEGMLMPHPNGSGEWGIIYNETIRSTGRRNFTLAHELGHYLLHRRAHPGGLKCSNRNMADWDEARNRIEGEANTFVSYLLMPIDDFRAQIKGRAIDIDVMTELSDRYAVSLTAAILKWMTITDKRAMMVVGKEGFIDWAGSEPVREMTVFSPGNEMSISLLLYPDRAPSRWEIAQLEEEPILRDLVEQLRQHGAVAVDAGGKLHRLDVRSGGVHGPGGPYAPSRRLKAIACRATIVCGPEHRACAPATRHRPGT